VLNPRDPAAPFGRAELASLFAVLAGRRGVVLAVSGGPDSTALLVLFDRWRQNVRASCAGAAPAGPPPAVVATVDHRLRPAAAAEAAAVAELAGRLGLAHRTLVWDGAKPAADLQAAARAARYRLLASLAAELDFDAVVTAHSRDDQAETLLLRLAHGSGVDGLAAMAPARPLADGVDLVRPLLDVPRGRLGACLAAAGVAAADDPSNADPRFARVRLRRLMPGLAAEGMTTERLAAVARRAGRAAAALAATADALATTALAVHPGGFARLDAAALAAAPEEIALRLLGRAVAVAGAPPTYGPRLERLEAALAAVLAGERVRRTLAGAVLDRRGDALWVYREAGREAAEDLTLAPGESGLWAGRFRAAVTAGAERPVRIAALGPAARRLLDVEPRREADPGPDLQGSEDAAPGSRSPNARLPGAPWTGDRLPGATRVPAAALARVPAAFVADRPVAVPAFGLYASPAWRQVVSIAPTGAA